MKAAGATMRSSRHTEGAEHLVGRARDARMADVADDGDRELREALPLCWRMVSASSSPCVGCDRCASPADSTLTCGATCAATCASTPGFGVADHEHVEVQRLQRVDGVEHALAFDARGQLHFQIDHLGARAPAGELEGHARAGGRLGEEIRDGHAPQRVPGGGALADVAREMLRPLEQRLDSARRRVLQRDQVTQRAVGAPLLNHARSIIACDLPPQASVPG